VLCKKEKIHEKKKGKKKRKKERKVRKKERRKEKKRRVRGGRGGRGGEERWSWNRTQLLLLLLLPNKPIFNEENLMNT
jgi:hypothetical protein